jgi:hypothetical protein
MNNAKWRELCDAFLSWSPPPRFRMRDLRAMPDHVTRWDSEWYHHPYPYVSIHWLEVELDADALPRALALCKQIGAAVEVGGAGLRIWGWVGPRDSPRFA